MPRRNRVDPWGDLHATPERGMFTGNRGCLVDDDGRLLRHHRGTLWITCVTSYRDWRKPLDAPRTWTPLFFLDDAVALAAGHRPCGLCRHDDYVSYQAAVAASLGTPEFLSAAKLNRMLGSERLRKGRGIDRSPDRMLWRAQLISLPNGSVVVGGAGDTPHLVIGKRLLPFSFAGWGPPADGDEDGVVDVLTPPTSVAALHGGFSPTLHPSARPP